MTTVNRVRNALDNYIKKNGDTNILKGSMENIIEKIGQTTDPDLAEIRDNLGFLTADYIKSTSGTAASDTERAYLISLLPSIKNSKELNDSFLNSFEDKLIGGMKSRIETAI